MAPVFDELSSRVIAAAIDVHKQLGPGFLESVYEQALKVALAKRSIALEQQKQVEVRFENVLVGVHVLDLMVEGRLVIELKAIKELDDVHYAQLRSYLRATGAKVGLLMNFNSPTLVVKRLVN